MWSILVNIEEFPWEIIGKLFTLLNISLIAQSLCNRTFLLNELIILLLLGLINLPGT